MELPDASEIPEPGFYYHYKHDPEGEFTNYAYEVLGLARETETEGFLVLYRPVYENDWIRPARQFVRPLESFTGLVPLNGTDVPRFARISDATLLSKLREARDEKYS